MKKTTIAIPIRTSDDGRHCDEGCGGLIEIAVGCICDGGEFDVSSAMPDIVGRCKHFCGRDDELAGGNGQWLRHPACLACLAAEQQAQGQGAEVERLRRAILEALDPEGECGLCSLACRARSALEAAVGGEQERLRRAAAEAATEGAALPIVELRGVNTWTTGRPMFTIGSPQPEVKE